MTTMPSLSRGCGRTEAWWTTKTGCGSQMCSGNCLQHTCRWSWRSVCREPTRTRETPAIIELTCTVRVGMLNSVLRRRMFPCRCSRLAQPVFAAWLGFHSGRATCSACAASGDNTVRGALSSACHAGRYQLCGLTIRCRWLIRELLITMQPKLLCFDRNCISTAAMILHSSV